MNDRPMTKVSDRQLYEQAVALRDLLADPAHWSKGSLAKTSAGGNTDPMRKEASCFCLVGAASRVIKDPRTRHIGNYEAVRLHPLGLLLANVIAGVQKWNYGIECLASAGPIYSFNDHAAHADVMEVLETAVAVAEGAL